MEIERKEKRIADAVALREPDRVPFLPQIGTAYTELGNVSKYEAMIDFRNFIPGIKYFLSRYDVDLFWTPAAYPISIMELLGTNFIKWPGPTNDLPLDSSHQIIDKSNMSEDEYDEFLKDPSFYILTHIYSARHEKLKGLKNLKVNLLGVGHFASFALFADPETREALEYMIQAGGLADKWRKEMAELVDVALELNTPLGNSAVGGSAYDVFADYIRGFLNVPIDLFTIPDKVVAACEAMDVYSKYAVDEAAGRGQKYAFIALHGGTDEMMSPEMYKKYYWPFLQRHIVRCVDHGMTPFVLTEGPYNTRLETLCEVPKGKVIYAFEKVDIAKAKKVLGDTACICGNISSTELIFGKKEKVIDETKRMIELCAPGGGFIMSNSISLDHYNEENFDAWYETTMKYGNY